MIIIPKNNVKEASGDLEQPDVEKRRSTHTRLTALSGTTRVSRYQKGKTNLVSLKQETVSSIGISWATCKSAPRSRQITMPASHHSKSFLQAGCPSCRPTNSVKALKAQKKTRSSSVLTRTGKSFILPALLRKHKLHCKIIVTSLMASRGPTFNKQIGVNCSLSISNVSVTLSQQACT